MSTNIKSDCIDYKKPLVTCCFFGQLGNQLFIIAATLGYAWDHDAVPIFPGLNTQRNRTFFNRDRIFFRLDTSQSPRQLINIYRTDLEKEWFSSKKIPFMPDLIIEGYFQSWRHFHHHREKICKIFAHSSYTLNQLQTKYSEWLRNPKTVGIHVRTQSKKTHDTGYHPFWGLEYYRNAIEQFPSDSIFIVVSDRINWCKHHFSKFGKKFVFAEGNYGIEDLFLLTKCQNLILCNSSFSWWAAYLNENNACQAIFPQYWMDPAMHSNPPPEDFFLPEWKIVPCPSKEPYPFDMWSYDRESQSIDNND